MARHHTRAVHTWMPGAAESLTAVLEALAGLDAAALDRRWRQVLGGSAPAGLSTALRMRILAYRLQVRAHGDLDRQTIQALERLAHRHMAEPMGAGDPLPVPDPRARTPGTLLTREWAGTLHSVEVLETGYAWNGTRYDSLSKVAYAITGTKWNGPRFFGLRASTRTAERAAAPKRRRRP